MNEQVVQKRIQDANKDFEQRLLTSNLVMQYDHDADIMYMAFGESKEAFSFDNPDVNGVYVRIAPTTYQVIGMDIHHFRKLFLPGHDEWFESFQAIFSELGDGDFRIRLDLQPAVGIKEANIGRVATYVPKTVRELVPA